MYVEELIGPETVNTMPEETISAFQDHGEVALTLDAGRRRGAAAVRATSPRRASTTTTSSDTLEREGVQKFSDSFDELLDGIRAKRGELAPAS